MGIAWRPCGELTQPSHRVCFVWEAAGPQNVEIVDYHGRENHMTKKLKPVHPGEILR